MRLIEPDAPVPVPVLVVAFASARARPPSSSSSSAIVVVDRPTPPPPRGRSTTKLAADGFNAMARGDDDATTTRRLATTRAIGQSRGLEWIKKR
jgi:hypothetical protein